MSALWAGGRFLSTHNHSLSSAFGYYLWCTPAERTQNLVLFA